MNDRPSRSRSLWPCSTAALGAAGCGVNEDLYNSTVKDRDAQKQKLADTQTALDAEKAQHKKDVDARDARMPVLSNKLTSLGQDVSRLETERGKPGRRARRGAEADGGAEARRRPRPRRAPRSSASW